MNFFFQNSLPLVKKHATGNMNLEYDTRHSLNLDINLNLSLQVLEIIVATDFLMLFYGILFLPFPILFELLGTISLGILFLFCQFGSKKAVSLFEKLVFDILIVMLLPYCFPGVSLLYINVVFHKYLGFPFFYQSLYNFCFKTLKIERPVTSTKSENFAILDWVSLLVFNGIYAYFLGVSIYYAFFGSQNFYVLVKNQLLVTFFKEQGVSFVVSLFSAFSLGLISSFSTHLIEKTCFYNNSLPEKNLNKIIGKYSFCSYIDPIYLSTFSQVTKVFSRFYFVNFQSGSLSFVIVEKGNFITIKRIQIETKISFECPQKGYLQLKEPTLLPKLKAISLFNSPEIVSIVSSENISSYLFKPAFPLCPSEYTKIFQLLYGFSPYFDFFASDSISDRSSVVLKNDENEVFGVLSSYNDPCSGKKILKITDLFKTECSVFYDGFYDYFYDTPTRFFNDPLFLQPLNELDKELIFSVLTVLNEFPGKIKFQETTIEEQRIFETVVENLVIESQYQVIEVSEEPVNKLPIGENQGNEILESGRVNEPAISRQIGDLPGAGIMFSAPGTEPIREIIVQKDQGIETPGSESAEKIASISALVLLTLNLKKVILDFFQKTKKPEILDLISDNGIAANAQTSLIVNRMLASAPQQNTVFRSPPQLQVAQSGTIHAPSSRSRIMPHAFPPDWVDRMTNQKKLTDREIQKMIQAAHRGDVNKQQIHTTAGILNAPCDRETAKKVDHISLRLNNILGPIMQEAFLLLQKVQGLTKISLKRLQDVEEKMRDEYGKIIEYKQLFHEPILTLIPEVTTLLKEGINVFYCVLKFLHGWVWTADVFEVQTEIDDLIFEIEGLEMDLSELMNNDLLSEIDKNNAATTLNNELQQLREKKQNAEQELNKLNAQGFPQRLTKLKDVFGDCIVFLRGLSILGIEITEGRPIPADPVYHKAHFEASYGITEKQILDAPKNISDENPIFALKYPKEVRAYLIENMCVEEGSNSPLNLGRMLRYWHIQLTVLELTVHAASCLISIEKIEKTLNPKNLSLFDEALIKKLSLEDLRLLKILDIIKQHFYHSDTSSTISKKGRETIFRKVWIKKLTEILKLQPQHKLQFLAPAFKNDNLGIYMHLALAREAAVRCDDVFSGTLNKTNLKKKQNITKHICNLGKSLQRYETQLFGLWGLIAGALNDIKTFTSGHKFKDKAVNLKTYLLQGVVPLSVHTEQLKTLQQQIKERSHHNDIIANFSKLLKNPPADQTAEDRIKMKNSIAFAMGLVRELNRNIRLLSRQTENAVSLEEVIISRSVTPENDTSSLEATFEDEMPSTSTTFEE